MAIAATTRSHESVAASAARRGLQGAPGTNTADASAYAAAAAAQGHGGARLNATSSVPLASTAPAPAATATDGHGGASSNAAQSLSLTHAVARSANHGSAARRVE